MSRMVWDCSIRCERRGTTGTTGVDGADAHQNGVNRTHLRRRSRRSRRALGHPFRFCTNSTRMHRERPSQAVLLQRQARQWGYTR